MKKTIVFAAFCCSAVVIAGCASPAPSPTTVTVQATPTLASSIMPPRETSAPETTALAPPPASTAAPVATAPTTAPAATTPPTTVAGPAAAEVLMPDVVCMNLQAAQNAIQAAGVFYSRSDDATGQGRSQLIDSNWTVVSQTPAAGTPIGEGDAVLSAVKIGEPGDCS